MKDVNITKINIKINSTFIHFLFISFNVHLIKLLLSSPLFIHFSINFSSSSSPIFYPMQLNMKLSYQGKNSSIYLNPIYSSLEYSRHYLIPLIQIVGLLGNLQHFWFNLNLMEEQNKFDGILMTIIQQKGNINGFFDTLFGFLRRRTDFFANQKQAQQTIVNSCKANFDKFTAQKKQAELLQQKRKDQAEKKKKQKQEKQAQQKRKAEQQKQTKVQQTPKQQTTSNPQQKSQTKEQDNEPAPKGNGGRTEKYIWTQTLENLEMFIFVDPDVIKKSTKINFTIDKLEVTVKGQSLINGKWKNKINPEETYWTIEDGQLDSYKGKYIHINIEKWKNQTSWWSTPIQGDQQINTQKINPEPSKLSDLDGQTRSTVQKMMFDMRQKQQGLPTSDELDKKRKMEEFMKAHPEMDFSQCKFG